MPDGVFDDLRARLDPLNVARRLGLIVQQNGYFLCPNDACPSRKMRKPRITAKAHRDGKWICTAQCGQGGDTPDLIEAVRGCSRREAIEEAKALAGMVDGALPPPPPKKPEPLELSDAGVKHAVRVLTIATDHYDRIRRDGASYLEEIRANDATIDQVLKGLGPARDYLNRRGLPPFKTYQVPIGLVPAWDTGLLGRLRQEFGARAAELGKAHGVLQRSKGWYETFHGRVWLPWQDADGKTVNAKGRAIEALSKHAGITLVDGRAERPMHFLRTSPGRKQKPHTIPPTHPFGWRAAMAIEAKFKKRRPVLVVEGEICALSVMSVGAPAVATGGAGGVGCAPLVRLSRDVDWDFCVVYDGDIEHETRTDVKRKARELAREMQCRWTLLPVGDLNDLLQPGKDGSRSRLKSGIAAALADAQKSPSPLRRSKSKTSPPPPRRNGEVSTEGHPLGWGDLTDGQLVRWAGKDDKSGEPIWDRTHIWNPPAVEWRGRDVYDQRLILGLRGKAAGLSDDVELAVPRDKLRTTRDIVAALSPVGYDVQQSTAGLLVRYLSDYERQFADRLELRTGTSQMGWHGSSFLYGDEIIGPGELSYIGSEPQRTAALDQSGTRDGWIEGVLRPLERHPLAMVGLYAALSAPVLHHCHDMTGFAVEYAGMSSRGKSTVSSAIASAFGDPRLDAGLLRPPMDTVVALEMYASFQGSLPLWWEDTHLVEPREKARDIIMAWVNGAGKGRGRRDGEGMQRVRRWKSVAVLTGEASVAGSTTFGGVGSRVLTFPPPLPDANDDRAVIEEIRQVERARVRHFGHAGREWVRFLVDGGVAVVLDAYDDWLSVLQRRAPLDGTAQRWAKALALVVATAQVAAPVIGGHDVHSDVLDVAIEHVAGVEPPDQAAVAMEMLLAWVAMEPRSGLDGETAEGPTDYQQKVWYRMLPSGVLCVGIVEAKRRMSEVGVNLPDVQAEWERRGWVGPKKRVTIKPRHSMWTMPIEAVVATEGLGKAREQVESEALH